MEEIHKSQIKTIESIVQPFKTIDTSVNVASFNYSPKNLKEMVSNEEPVRTSTKADFKTSKNSFKSRNNRNERIDTLTSTQSKNSNNEDLTLLISNLVDEMTKTKEELKNISKNNTRQE